jgi:tetratricopeptide (TPR) repeat protein
MRMTAIGLTLMLAALPSPAPASGQNNEQCPGYSPEATIRACSALIQASQGRPDDLAFYYRVRAFNHERLGQFDRAVQDYSEMIRLDPSAAGPVFERGTAYLAEGQTDHALQDFNETIRLQPSNTVVVRGAEAGVFERRGAIYETKGLYDDAIADYTEAIVRRTALMTVAPHADPGHAAYNARGRVLHLKGDDTKALPDADKAVSLKPNEPAYLETRAEIREKLGRRDDAVADYRTALKLNPNLQQAAIGLRRLGSVP